MSTCSVQGSILSLGIASVGSKGRRYSQAFSTEGTIQKFPAGSHSIQCSVQVRSTKVSPGFAGGHHVRFLQESRSPFEAIA